MQFVALCVSMLDFDYFLFFFWSDHKCKVYKTFLSQNCVLIGLQDMKLFDNVTSPHTYEVVNGVVHALTSRDPRSYYVIGLDAKVMAWLSIMPSCITDFVVLKLAGGTPGPNKKDLSS